VADLAFVVVILLFCVLAVAYARVAPHL